MLIRSQVGRKEKKNKKPRKGRENHFFQGTEVETAMLEILRRTCKTWQEANRRSRILQMRESQRRFEKGEMKGQPKNSQHLYKATLADEADYMLHGPTFCRQDNPLGGYGDRNLTIERKFCPSDPIRKAMDRYWPREGKASKSFNDHDPRGAYPTAIESFE